MNGKQLLVLYGCLAAASAVSTLVYAQLKKPRELPGFSYDMQFYEYDENGAKKYTHTDHFAVRSDGSTASVDDSTLAKFGERLVSVRDYTKRVSWVTSLLGYTVTTLPLAEQTLPAVHYEQCDEGESSTLGGYEVRGERRVLRNQETDELLFIVERWRAPELGCMPLRVVRYDNDEKLTHERVAANIVIAEPDPSLFQVPAGYEESSPMQAQQKRVDLGVASPIRDDEGILDRAERRYRGTQ